jgi:hypothetical protein
MQIINLKQTLQLVQPLQRVLHAADCPGLKVYATVSASACPPPLDSLK